tara:strand:- start:371 stop:667 length:297 start_codon:yes stop_codon:yes gene_type:complete
MELEKINELPVLQRSVVLAYRDTLTDCSKETLKRTYDKLEEDFPHLTSEIIVNGINRGLKGEYGIPLKVSPAIVSYWVTQYLKEKNPKRTMANAFSQW